MFLNGCFLGQNDIISMLCTGCSLERIRVWIYKNTIRKQYLRMYVVYIEVSISWPRGRHTWPGLNRSKKRVLFAGFDFEWSKQTNVRVWITDVNRSRIRMHAKDNWIDSYHCIYLTDQSTDSIGKQTVLGRVEINRKIDINW